MRSLQDQTGESKIGELENTVKQISSRKLTSLRDSLGHMWSGTCVKGPFPFKAQFGGFVLSGSRGEGVGNATTGSKLQKCKQTLQHPERAISILRLWLVHGATLRVSSLVLGEWGWNSFASVNDSPDGGVRSVVYKCTAALSVQLDFGFCSALWSQLQRSL